MLKETSDNLSNKLGRGFSETNLKQMRDFYLVYSIRQMASDELKIDYSLSDIANENPISSNDLRISTTNLSQSKDPIFTLSWSHYLILMRIDNGDERNFYEIETFANQWKTKELQRQVNSSLFERLALSKDKEGVLKLAKEGLPTIKN